MTRSDQKWSETGYRCLIVSPTDKCRALALFSLGVLLDDVVVLYYYYISNSMGVVMRAAAGYTNFAVGPTNLAKVWRRWLPPQNPQTSLAKAAEGSAVICPPASNAL